LFFARRTKPSGAGSTAAELLNDIDSGRITSREITVASMTSSTMADGYKMDAGAIAEESAKANTVRG
jgi:hypothetical protein